MNSELTVAVFSSLAAGLFAGIVTAFGWFVTDWQRRKQAREDRRVEFIRRQIDELYAPLSAVAGNERRYQELAKQLKQDDDRHQMTERFIVPTQRDIATLLNAKEHLIGVDKEPASFEKARAHCSQALALWDLSKTQGRDFLNVDAEPMPVAFAADVEGILEQLKSEHNRLTRVRLAAAGVSPFS